MVGTVLFFLFAGLAIASAVSMVYHKNPLYSAISLVGVFISLSCIYVTLAAPFIPTIPGTDTTTIVTITFAIATGSKNFQPKFIN